MGGFLEDLKNSHHDFDPGVFELGDFTDPWKAFEKWTLEAIREEVNEPNAMSVSSVDDQGQPSSRIVYLKDVVDQQLTFFTNYKSEKGRELRANNRCCLLFFWPELSRQIKVYGRATRTSTRISDEYFQSRPYPSKIGAWASHQSEKLESKEELQNRLKELKKEYPEEVPRPDHWGGIQVDPDYFEFWQGQPSRLHDRMVFEKDGDHWSTYRLNP